MDSVVKMILIFGGGTSLFIVLQPHGDETFDWLENDMSWAKVSKKTLTHTHIKDTNKHYI